MTDTYEQKVIKWLQDMLIKHDPQIGPGGKRIHVEEVRLEAEETEGDWVVILFREVRRPHCIFGFRTSPREPTAQGAAEWQREVWDDPDGRGPQVTADMITARLREHIEAADMGLPQDCDASGINWI